jgi:predicted GIY-YIG superfamily endonuclease
MKMYYVYILESKKDKSLYIGYSSDLKKELLLTRKAGRVTLKTKGL